MMWMAAKVTKMKSIHVLALGLALCIAGMGCVPDLPGTDNTNPPNTPHTPDTPDTPPSGITDPSKPAPVAAFTFKKVFLKGVFDAASVSSLSYPASELMVRWDFTDDGVFDTEWSSVKGGIYTYLADGIYRIRLEVKDPNGKTDTAARRVTIVKTNTAPVPAFNVLQVQGMIASLDASPSSDNEDLTEDLQFRWDFNGDNTYDTDWTTVKIAQHLYTIAGEYTIRLQVKDLNDTVRTLSQPFVASPISVRSSYSSRGRL